MHDVSNGPGTADWAKAVSPLPFHPVANVFPLLEGEQFRELAEDIQAHGLQEPIVLFEGKILDGRNRYRACFTGRVAPQFRTFDERDGNPVAFVISANLRRRHLNDSQRAIIAAQLEKLKHGGDRKTDQDANLHLDRGRVAELLNVSPRTVASGRKVVVHGIDDLRRKVESGTLSVSAAADVAELPEAEQREIIAKGEKWILEKAKDIRAGRAEQRCAEIAALRAETAAAIPEGKYGTIVIDPPWPMRKIERDVRPNQVAFDYPTMTEEELAAFPVGEHGGRGLSPVLLDDAAFLARGAAPRRSLGVPLLPPDGVAQAGRLSAGRTAAIQLRVRHLCAARLAGIRRYQGVPVRFHAERREHSRKPDEFYQLIARVTDGPRIDVFSREPREGFAQFGNETEKFCA